MSLTFPPKAHSLPPKELQKACGNYQSLGVTEGHKSLIHKTKSDQLLGRRLLQKNIHFEVAAAGLKYVTHHSHEQHHTAIIS